MYVISPNPFLSLFFTLFSPFLSPPVPLSPFLSPPLPSCPLLSPPVPSRPPLSLPIPLSPFLSPLSPPVPLDYTMVNFVKPNLLGTQKEFTNRFMNPITNGQCRDSSPFDIRRMKQRAHVLHTLLQGTVQVTPSSPPSPQI